MENYSEIISKAKELSQMIENHEITVKYKESLVRMHSDVEAQTILADLVMMGRSLNESLVSGDDSKRPGAAEMDMLKQEFERNETVKNHILAQREYLNMISLVQDKIKNPSE